MALKVVHMSAAEKLLRYGAHEFLDALGESHSFQTFGEGAGKGNRSLTCVRHGTLAQHGDTLRRLNMRGAGVYVMLNAGNGKARNASAVERVRAVFADLDGAPLEPVQRFELAPHVIVETSPGHWQCHWLAEGVPLEAFRDLQKAIAAKFDGDAKVCDLGRVVRLPGFLHRKAAPFESRIVQWHDGPRYTHAELVAAFKPGGGRRAKSTLPDTIPEGTRNSTLFALAGGFVQQGFSEQAINDRLQRMNAERCEPPLCAGEVDALVANACKAGSSGFASLPHKLLDHSQWKALPPQACMIVVGAFRRFNGSNNGNIALTWADFEGRPGFGKRDSFYKYRKAAQDAGFLRLVTRGSNSQQGRKPDLFAIPGKWLRQAHTPKREPGPIPPKGNPYVDKQGEGERGAK